MVKNGIEFHNVAEAGARAGLPGLFLHRYPAEVRKHLSELGRTAAACSDGAEIRFCTESEWGSITVSAHRCLFGTEGRIDLYKGDFLCASHTVEQGRQCTIRLAPPPLGLLNERAFVDARFSPSVWRLALHRGLFVFHHLDSAGAAVRPPRKDEKPGRRWLAYGSSITNAAADGYVHHAARLLGVDVLNKGLTGSCLCEKETATYLASGEEWDFATLELGANMRGAFSAAAFAKRAAVFVAALRKGNKSKPIVLLTVFPNGDDFLRAPNNLTESNRAFREALRALASRSRDPHLHLIEGDRVLSCFGGLSQDMIHPSPAGHVLMGANLATLLRDLLPEKGGAR